MVTRIFALTTRGMEELSAREMAQIPGLEILEMSYRRISASYLGKLDSLMDLMTVDDVFVDLGSWEGLAAQRSALSDIYKRSQSLKVKEAVRTVKQVRNLPQSPVFSVTVNFVGKRNYSYLEIRKAVGEGIQESSGWQYHEDDNLSDINFRVFIEHQTAYLGLRLAKQSLQRRWYKQVHVAGSLKPPVAATMVQLACPTNPGFILDPFCGAGTILIEAELQGCRTAGGDRDVEVLMAARMNAVSAGVNIGLSIWDAHQFPLADHSTHRIVSNLPWGRQISIGMDVERQYDLFSKELQRILHPHGIAVLLTTSPELVELTGFRKDRQYEISLFGQRPTLMVLKPDKHT